jgi:hypothetical protein
MQSYNVVAVGDRIANAERCYDFRIERTTTEGFDERKISNGGYSHE